MNVFAEVEPNQEERILLASKKANNVIGYLRKGDASLIPLAAQHITISANVYASKA